MAYISRLSLLRHIIKENPNAIIITERSVFTDKEVFAKMLYDDNKIEEVNYKIYLQWFNEFIHDIPINGILYVKTTPEKSKTRVDFRSRQGEQIPLSYLQKCHEYHEHWINNEYKTKTLIFDGNNDFKNNLPLSWVSNIKEFINLRMTDKAIEQSLNSSQSSSEDNIIELDNWYC